jgi:hypothetical protein
MGKSTLQYNLAMLNIFAERGVAVIDPHGDLAEAIADSIPRRRDQPVGFNPLANVPPDRKRLRPRARCRRSSTYRAIRAGRGLSICTTTAFQLCSIVGRRP